MYQQQPVYSQQPAYSPQPQPQPRQDFQTQIDPSGRKRRGDRHGEEAAPLYSQNNPENLVQFPVGAQQPQQEAQQAGIDAYVINVFNLSSCRQAMSCLRRGQCTLIVMDQLFDKAEIRRYVDMLTGACYALNGTMTRLSAKIGFYIMAPEGMTVYTDPTTSNANASRPSAPSAPGYTAPSQGNPARQSPEFSAQSAYAAPPQMNFSAHQVETRQPAQEGQPYAHYASPPQEQAPQSHYAQQDGYQNTYASYQEDQQRYAQ